MMELLCRLGKEWGKAPVLWLWGGLFESYRCWSQDEDQAPTFVHLNWRPETSDRYGGTLTLTLYGLDGSFLASILDECRKLGGFREVTVPGIELPKGEMPRLEDLRKPVLEREETRFRFSTSQCFSQSLIE